MTGTETETETALGMAADTIVVMEEAAELQRLSVHETVSATGNGDGADGGQQAAVPGAAAELTADAAAEGCHHSSRHQHAAMRSPAQSLTAAQRRGLCSDVEQRTLRINGANRRRRAMIDRQVSLVEAVLHSPHLVR